MNLDHTWLTSHSHDPNPEPPSQDPTFKLQLPSGKEKIIDLSLLQSLPSATISDCYIVSTGHGTSGPFAFTGTKLEVLIAHCIQQDQETWSYAHVISADGFGTQVLAQEIANQETMLFAYTLDGVDMSREQGLVRLIVPSERDDALRQVKWVGEVVLG